MSTTSDERPPEARPAADDNGESLFELFKPRPGDPPSIRYLRLAVISMGVILLLVFVAVIGRLAYLLTRPVATTADAPAIASGSDAAKGTPLPSTLQPDIQLNLPPSARLRTHTLSGNRLSVHYESSGGDGIMVIDLESGRPLSHVRIQAPRN